MRRLLIAALLLATASACGFRLRGQQPLPAVMARPFVDARDHYTPLYAALDARLRAAGARPVASATGA
ncbi:MAG TPA: hypothetical protein VFM30_11225, partial [Steroidobacteraceae bacterium]|nr:hypothetical protein [Steroidobacteraceae bacterium]